MKLPARRSFWCVALLWQGLVLGTASVTAGTIPHLPASAIRDPFAVSLACLYGGVGLYVLGLVALTIRYVQRRWPFEPHALLRVEPSALLTEVARAAHQADLDALEEHVTRDARLLIFASLLAGVGAGLLGLLRRADLAGPLQLATAIPIGVLAGLVHVRRRPGVGAAMLITYLLVCFAVLIAALSYARGSLYAKEDVLGGFAAIAVVTTMVAVLVGTADVDAL